MAYSAGNATLSPPARTTSAAVKATRTEIAVATLVILPVVIVTLPMLDARMAADPGAPASPWSCVLTRCSSASDGQRHVHHRCKDGTAVFCCGGRGNFGGGWLRHRFRLPTNRPMVVRGDELSVR